MKIIILVGRNSSGGGKKNSGAGFRCWNGSKFTIKKTRWPNLEGAFFVNASKLVRFVQLQSNAKWNPPKHVYYNLKRMVKVGGQWRSSNPPVFGQMARYKEWMFAKADWRFMATLLRIPPSNRCCFYLSASVALLLRQ